MTISRRELLKGLTAFGVGATWPRSVRAEAKSSPVIDYLETLARPDGGYAFQDQADSHLTATFAVIACYRSLGEMPPNPAKLAEFVRSHHPSELKKLEQERRIFEFQQIQSLFWLQSNPAVLRDRIASWTQPL